MERIAHPEVLGNSVRKFLMVDLQQETNFLPANSINVRFAAKSV